MSIGIRPSFAVPRRATLALLLTLFAQAAVANTGLVLFSRGDVKIEREGATAALTRGMRVKQGDRIRTGEKGRTHIRMSDRSLISIRPRSEFEIESYRYDDVAAPQPVATPTALQPPPATSPADSSQALFRLVRGGFRAITGLIAKRDRSNVGFRTPVATIGIRGTALSAECLGSDATSSGDCSGGLLFGSTLGSISGTTSRGSLVLMANEAGFIGTDGSLKRLAEWPAALSDVSEVDGELDDDGGDSPLPASGLITRRAPGNKRETTADGGEESIVIIETEEPAPRFRRDLSYAIHEQTPDLDQSITLELPDSAIAQLADGRVAGFAGLFPAVDADGSAALVAGVIGPDAEDPFAVFNNGRDEATGLSWGRWAGGNAILALGDGSSTLVDTDALGLHYITSDATEGTPGIPRTGSASYTLSGNTDPTSNLGARGVLGAASLTADFSNQTVASELSLSISSRLWQATGTGALGNALSADTPANIFAGRYGSVMIDGRADGDGEFSGFLVPGGAGLSYSLGDGRQRVSGAAAFRQDP